MTECKTCGPKNCQTCGEHDQEKLVIQCEACDAEGLYYQMMRWRKAAMAGQEAVLALSRPKWWQRLLRLKAAPALPGALGEAVRDALELEGDG